MTIFYEKAEECPVCNKAADGHGFSYDGQACTRCGWGITPDIPMRTHMAMNDVITERCRQIHAEGWTPEDDDIYVGGQLALAAGEYALHSTGRYGTTGGGASHLWPFDKKWWKPTTPRRDLVKAAALILAEIERLDRAAEAGK